MTEITKPWRDLYSRVVFPCLCDLVLRWPAINRARRRLLAAARGRVLEIGVGSGLNLACYPREVRRLTTVDVNPGMQRLAQQRARRAGIRVEHHVASGERLPLDSAAFDCVVSTFTLCSIDDVERALAEVHRVLKPQGRFLFLEHGLSPDPAVQRWQRRLNPLEMRLADGCRLDRDIGALVGGQPFGTCAIEQYDLPWTPRTHGHLYRGEATR